MGQGSPDGIESECVLGTFSRCRAECLAELSIIEKIYTELRQPFGILGKQDVAAMLEAQALGGNWMRHDGFAHSHRINHLQLRAPPVEARTHVDHGPSHHGPDVVNEAHHLDALILCRRCQEGCRRVAPDNPEFGFRPLFHRLQIHGICGKCLAERGPVVALSEMAIGERGAVESLGGGRGARRRLEELGLVPGTAVEVLANLGLKLVLVRGSRVAIGPGLAAKVLVRRGAG